MRRHRIIKNAVRHLFFIVSREEHCRVKFFNGGRYLQSILKSTMRRLRSLRTITSPSTFEVVVFLLGISGISLVNTSIVIKKSFCFCVYIKQIIDECTEQKLTKECIVLAQAAGARLVSEVVSPYLMFKYTMHVSEVLSRK